MTIKAPDGKAGIGRKYAIFSAFSEEANDGWIWQKEFGSRTIITVSREHNRRNLKIFCAVRKFDPNFIHRYNEGAAGSNERHSPGQRYKIEDEPKSLVMNEWYREHCLGIPPHSGHPGKSEVQLDIREAKWGCPPRTWFPGVRAACHQPDIAIRLGTRLGVLGGWLGVSGLMFALVAAFHQLLGDTEITLTALVAVISLIAGILSIRICLPPKQA
jgi:hypothetical protein